MAVGLAISVAPTRQQGAQVRTAALDRQPVAQTRFDHSEATRVDHGHFSHIQHDVTAIGDATDDLLTQDALRLAARKLTGGMQPHPVRSLLTVDPKSHADAAFCKRHADGNQLAPNRGRLTPQRLSRDLNVLGCSPRRRAAPRSPSMTQLVSASTFST